MTSSTLLSDIVLPAATWYEKHDLNTTDMHPFVHAFNPAIDPPFEAARTSTRSTRSPAASPSWPAPTWVCAVTWSPCRCSTTPRRDRTAGWPGAGLAAGECPAVPGRTMPNLVVVERDYPAVAEKMASIGPLIDRLGMTTKAVTYTPTRRSRTSPPTTA